MKWYKRDRFWWEQKELVDLRRFPMPPAVPHFVYVIGRQGGPTKIGICRELTSRIRALQTACPFEVDLFWSALFPTQHMARTIEAQALAEFPRANGEWFSADPSSIIRFLEA